MSQTEPRLPDSEERPAGQFCRWQLRLIVTFLSALLPSVGRASGVTVRLNVLTDDPNDPNVLCDPNHPVEADASSSLNYYITARVEPGNTNVTNGLDALYVTRKTSFAVDANRVQSDFGGSDTAWVSAHASDPADGCCRFPMQF
ncbi:MAG: hypothetical protein JXQ73_08880 [Phycisphaerae bacterium]|nr:hypothetical protein [Phycisphaerae bacterium]